MKALVRQLLEAALATKSGAGGVRRLLSHNGYMTPGERVIGWLTEKRQLGRNYSHWKVYPNN